MKERLTFGKMVCYSIGQLGWSILMGIINQYLVWFFIPPQDAGLPILIPQIRIMGFLTIVGLITMTGRLFDAVTDPLIASYSDRSQSRMGRRISFMAKGAVPAALFTALAFWSPSDAESLVNVIWLAGSLYLFYFFYTVYVTPYFALISELGHTPEERVNISTSISVTFFLGTGISFMAPTLWGMLEGGGMPKVQAVRLVIAGMSVLAAFLMMVPVLTVDEKRYSIGSPSQAKFMESVKKTFRNKYFRIFVLSDLAYFLALTVFTTGLMYYVTVLLQLPESNVSFLNPLMVVISFIFYPVVNIMAKKLGKKKLMVFAFAVFIVMYFYTFVLGSSFMPFPPIVQGYILAFMAALPMSIFGILPNVIVADIAENDAIITGEKREAMFFGVRTFMSKMGQTLAMLIFSSLLLYGKDIGHDLGVRLTGPAAGVVCAVGLILFLMYNEKEVMSAKNKQSSPADNLIEVE